MFFSFLFAKELYVLINNSSYSKMLLFLNLASWHDLGHNFVVKNSKYIANIRKINLSSCLRSVKLPFMSELTEALKAQEDLSIH